MSILLVIVVVAIVLLYPSYTGVIKNKNKVQEALASIDTQLEKRHDLIPNILMMANKFMEHERSLIEEVTQLRTKALNTQASLSNMHEKIQVESELQSKLGQLIVSAENYPQLKSNETMVQAMQTFAEVEEQISAARRFYNAAVRDLNNSVEIFPSSIWATMLNVDELPFFEITDEAAKEPINAMAYFK